MHLEVPASATLRALDAYLRDLWLECCGHLSAFETGGHTYSVDADLLGAEPGSTSDVQDRSMDVGVGVALRTGEEARHVYDMGSTTELRVRCLEQRAGHGAIRLLARNAQPMTACSACGGSATTICPDCSWDGKGMLCDGCATAHPCDDEMYMPVVNSPCTGVCAYMG